MPKRRAAGVEDCVYEGGDVYWPPPGKEWGAESSQRGEGSLLLRKESLLTGGRTVERNDHTHQLAN